MKIIEKKKKDEYLASFVFMLDFFSLRREYKCLNFQCFVFFPFEMDYLKCVNWCITFYIFIYCYLLFFLCSSKKLKSIFCSFQKANLGTVAGVYLPCIQNILGVIFFIRLGWIVGTAGVPMAFLIVFLSCAVVSLTILIIICKYFDIKIYWYASQKFWEVLS